MSRSSEPFPRLHALRRLDPFRYLDRDLDRAVTSLFAGRHTRDAFHVDLRKDAPLDLVLKQLGGDFEPILEPGSLAETDRGEIQRVLIEVKGRNWATRALSWLEDGIPALVLVVVRSKDLIDEYELADGAARLSLAEALGHDSLPIAILKRPRGGV